MTVCLFNGDFGYLHKLSVSWHIVRHMILARNMYSIYVNEMAGPMVIKTDN